MFRLVTFVAALIVLALIGYLLSRPAINEGALEQTKKLILSQSFSCPDGTSENLKRWYLDGYVRRCADEKSRAQGPMIGWRSGHLVVQGSYLDGVRDGEWLWYSINGDTKRKEHYEKGHKVNGNVDDTQ